MASAPQDQDEVLIVWCNEQLKKKGLVIKDVVEDISDGIILINLLEVVSKKTIPKYNKTCKIPTHKYENTGIAISFCETEGIRLVNIGNTDITDGNLKLIQGLLWTLMEHYQFGASYKEARNKLLEWIKGQIPSYNITGFHGKQWNDGKALCALVDSISPGLYGEHEKMPNETDEQRRANCDKGLGLSLQHYDIPRLLSPEQFANPAVSEQALVTYLSYFPKVTPVKVNMAPACSASGPGLANATSGLPADFVVKTPKKDCGKLDVRVEGPASTATPTVTPKGDGTYDVKYTPTEPGDYKVHVTLDDAPIPGSPFSVKVAPHPSAGVKAAGPGLANAVEGHPADFKVMNVPAAGAGAGAGAGDGDGGKLEVTVDGPDKSCTPVVTPKGDGTYDCQYKPTVPGDYKVNVTVGGKHVDGSPFTVKVAEHGESTAAGPGLETGQVNAPGEFKVTTPHETGDAAAAHPDCKLDVKVEGPSSAAAAPVITDNGDGSYDCKYTPTEEGDYKVNVTVGGKHVKGSPFAVKIEPHPALRSSCSGDGLVDGMEAVPGDFTCVTPGRTSGKLEVRVEGPPGNDGSNPEITDNQDGSYGCRYTPSVPGDYNVHVTLGGVPVKGSPFKVHVLPEDPIEAARRHPLVCHCEVPEPNMFDKRFCRVCQKWTMDHFLELRAKAKAKQAAA